MRFLYKRYARMILISEYVNELRMYIWANIFCKKLYSEKVGTSSYVAKFENRGLSLDHSICILHVCVGLCADATAEFQMCVFELTHTHTSICMPEVGWRRSTEYSISMSLWFYVKLETGSFCFVMSVRCNSFCA